MLSVFVPAEFSLKKAASDDLAALPESAVWIDLVKPTAAGTITNSLLAEKIPYSESDLVPVGMIAVSPSVIVVHPSAPFDNLNEFVAYAKNNP